MFRKAFAAMIGAVAIAGCGGTKTVTTTTTATLNLTNTTTDTQTTTRFRQQAPTVTTTVNHTTTAPAPAPPTTASFSGSGQKSVGTINVPHDETLAWTCSGDCSTFAIDNDPGDTNSISLNASDQHSGTTAIPAGTYHQVQILTIGDWTFKIS